MMLYKRLLNFLKVTFFQRFENIVNVLINLPVKRIWSRYKLKILIVFQSKSRELFTTKNLQSK
ncbi:hypothetical protein A3464_19655 [Enterobacter genomosp. O]|nr:hypothetical protein A3464_19655 [Enterobacter genomosp. O]